MAILAIRPTAEAGDRRVAPGGDLHRAVDRMGVGRVRTPCGAWARHVCRFGVRECVICESKCNVVG